MTNDPAPSTDAPKKQLSTPAKLITEMGPLLIFFASFKFGDLMVATAVFMAAMSAAMIYNWVKIRHIPTMLWVTFAIVIVTGSLTIYLQDETFIKMKPTLVNAFFASILLVGVITGRPFIKHVLSEGLPGLEEKGWIILSRNFGLFFLVMAGLNELIWRNVSTDTWMNFKTFGYLPITLVFTVVQIMAISKYLPEGALEGKTDSDQEKD